MDLFNGLLGSVQVTALHVTRLDNVTVAHMGTTDGRILQVSPLPHNPWPFSPVSILIFLTVDLSQVELVRSLNYLLYVSNFSLSNSRQSIHRDVRRLGDHLLFASGDQVRWAWSESRARVVESEPFYPFRGDIDAQVSPPQSTMGIEGSMGPSSLLHSP